MQSISLISDFLRTGLDDTDGQLKILKEISNCITTNRASLLRLVADLGDYLVEDNASIRSRAMRLLEGVIAQLPPDVLSGQHVTVMVQFFCDRTTDDVCIMESLAALSTLSKMKLFANEDAEKVILTVTQMAVAINKLPQRTRYQMYSLLDKLMATRRQLMKKFSPQLLTAFSDLMNGEKDPRNLMLAFSILRIMLEEFDIDENSIADLFDSVYCYFPITFRPQSDEPLTITTDDLKLRLRKCLSATPRFAPYLIPALIEKLNAVATSVKKDTLLTLIDCCELYDSNTLGPYTSQLWAALKFEMIQSEDALLEDVVLAALSAITTCLTAGLDAMPKSSSLSRWLHPIISEAGVELREADLKSARPCGKILHSVAISSRVSLSVVCQALLPALIALCQEADSSDKRATLLGVISDLVRANVEIQCIRRMSETDRSSCLAFASSELLQLLIPAIVTPEHHEREVQDISIKCLQDLVVINGLLPDHDVMQIIKHLASTLVTKSLEDQGSVLGGLCEIAKVKSHLILDHAFPILLAALPDYSAAGKEMETDRMLQCLSTLATEKPIFDCLIIRVLSRLDTCISSKASPIHYATSLLHTIRQGLTHFDGLQYQFYDALVPKLCSMVLRYPASQLADPTSMKIINDIINVVIRTSSLEKQTQICAALFSREASVTHGKPAPEQRLGITHLGAYLEEGRKANIDSVLVAQLISMRREVEVVKTLDHDLLSKSVRIVTQSDNPFLLNSHQVLVASLLNKCGQDSDVNLFLSSIASVLEASTRKNVEFTMWITKGLMLRGHKLAGQIIHRIIDLLSSEELGDCIARGFKILLEPHDALSKINHANVRTLYMQKFYSLVVPELITQLKSAPTDMRSRYLRTLSTIIANTPKSIYIADLTNIYPVLLQCMTLSETDIKYCAIITLHSIGSAGRDLAASHLSTLVPNLLLCSENGEFSTPQVRIASLRLLGELVDLLRADKLQPYKVRIIRALGEVLDDKKRHVRKEAVLTRQKYFLVL